MALIYNALRAYMAQGREITVVHGAARGADTLAGEAAKRCGFAVEEYPADWRQWGKRAGPIRNQRMLDEGKPQIVHAFHDHILDSKGTRDMIYRALGAGLPVYLHQHGSDALLIPESDRRSFAPYRKLS